MPKEVPGLTWCACLFERHQASSSCVAMAARWCAARVRAFRRRRSRSSAAAAVVASSVAPRRRAAEAVATRTHARARRISAGGSKICGLFQRPGSPFELARLVQAAALTMDRARRCLYDHEITLKAKAPAAKH